MAPTKMSIEDLGWWLVLWMELALRGKVEITARHIAQSNYNIDPWRVYAS